MKFSILLGMCLLVASSSRIESAQPEGEKNSAAGLGELARQLRAERAKISVRPAKVFTNDDLAGATTPAVVGSLPETVQQPTAREPSSSARAGHDTSGEKFFRQKIRELRKQLEIDQHSLEGLKEAMGGKAQEGYYQWLQTTNPAIFFEFFGGWPKESTDILDRAEERIESDKKAITDLEAQCRSDKDCQPSWLR